MYLFFESLSPFWINLATIIGAIISIALGFFAIWLTLFLNKKSEHVFNEMTLTTSLIKDHTKVLRLDSLRTLYELSNGTDSRSYWHFRWRFETYNNLTISLVHFNEILIGDCSISILGFSLNPKTFGFENCKSEYYIVKINNISPDHIANFPFQINNQLACFHSNGNNIISTGLDPWTQEPKYKFSINGLGGIQFGTGEPLAKDVTFFSRVKDS